MKIIRHLLVILLYVFSSSALWSQVEIEYNSSVIPQLNLIETQDNDWARLYFKNSNSISYRWALSGKLGTNNSEHEFGLYYNGADRWVYDESLAQFQVHGSQIINSPFDASSMIFTSRQIAVKDENSVSLFQLGDSGNGSLDEGQLWLYWDDGGVQKNGIFLEADDNDGGEITLYNGNQVQRIFLKAGPDDLDAARFHIEGISESNGLSDGEAQHLIELVNDKTSTGVSDDTKFYLGVMEDYLGTPGVTEEVLTIAYQTGSTAPANSDVIAKIDELGNYAMVSDRRLKANIQPLNNVLDKVLSLTPSSYYFKKDLSKQNQIGFIAQDIESHFPDLADGDDSQEDQYMTVNYQGMIPVLTRAIQEQQMIIDQQKSEIESLRNEVENLALLKNQMAQLKSEIADILNKEVSETGDDE
ncbi:MAG: tail fiber domain-containing protein [Saprospiraceae bacterium]|nr:tail fiber domain-containing protein [Saprospiraceae bacterium]